MSKISAVTKEHCASKTWRVVNALGTARQEAVVLLAASELPMALMSCPAGFISGAKGYQLVAIQGFDPGVNLQVTQNGKWQGAYLPRIYRCPPFLLVSTSDGGRALCVDENVAEIEEHGGEPFYGDDGELAPKVAEVLRTLVDFEKERIATDNVCTQLAELALIEPWDITVNKGQGQSKIQGLFRIDEAKLSQLDGAQLEQLRNSGGLVLAYCQLLSMQNLSKLGRLYQEQQRAQSDVIEGLQAFGMSAQDGTLSFENL
ncbi:MAG: SapC family protein [Pseudomonadales bacterium]|nr:SapC family protein [Pseudomonadales bacterium]